MRRPRVLRILSTPDGLDEAFGRLEGRRPLAVDTETSGLPWWKELVGAICLAANDTAYFCYKGALAPAAKFLGRQVRRERALVFHNAKFDLHHMRKTFGLHVPYPVHDTAVMSFLVDNRGVHAYGKWKDKPHGLKPLASVFVDPDAEEPEKALLAQIRARGGTDKGDWLLADEALFGEYGALDPWYTLRLYEQFIERIRHWPQPSDEDTDSLMSLYDLERWCILAFRDMEARGICADREFLERWRVETLEPELAKTKAKLLELAGRDINWNSVPQLRQLLFGKRKDGGLGLVPERFTEPTEKQRVGQPSTDTVALLDLKHPIGAVLVQYRALFKQWSSYAVSLVESIADDGAIHPSFKSTGAETGRTSCVDPNLQQQTRVSGVRKAYRPRKGLVFRFADYSQVEMRLAGHFGNEPVLIDGFCNDPDFDTHDGTARMMFGKSYDPTSQHRKFAKILNFTTVFGGGEAKVTEQLVDLMDIDEATAGCRAFEADVPPGTTPWRVLAHELKVRYKATFPNLIRALREEADTAERRGYAMHAFGGHRFLEDRWYRAFNTKVQGTAGVQAKRGLVNVYRELQLGSGELALLLLIHDEIVYESEGNPRTDRRVLELMQELTRFKVPIIAEMSGSSTTWQDKVKVKL